MFENQDYPNFFQGFLLVVLYFFLGLLLQSLFMFISSFLNIESAVVKEGVFSFILVPLLVNYLVIKYALNKPGQSLAKITGNNFFSFSIYFYALLATIGSAITISRLDSFISDLFPGGFYLEAVTQLMEQPLIIIVIAVVIIPAIFEEIIFRGILLNGFARFYRLWMAITMSAFLFSVIHLNIRQGLGAFLMGIFLGWLYLRYHSLVLVIFVHAINNLMAVISFRVIAAYDLALEEVGQQPLWFTMLGLFMLLTGLYFLSKRESFTNTDAVVNSFE